MHGRCNVGEVKPIPLIGLAVGELCYKCIEVLVLSCGCIEGGKNSSSKIKDLDRH